MEGEVRLELWHWDLKHRVPLIELNTEEWDLLPSAKYTVLGLRLHIRQSYVLVC